MPKPLTVHAVGGFFFAFPLKTNFLECEIAKIMDVKSNGVLYREHKFIGSSCLAVRHSAVSRAFFL
jgi:hypothetical protein